ncbi:MAG: cytochrome c [Nitrospirales bacterium]
MKSRILGCCLIVLIGWTISAEAQEPQVDPLKGEAVYKAHCVRCHGIQGRGDGPDAAKLIVPPANFHRQQSRAKSEMDLRSAIIWGLAFSPMHGWWDQISVEDIRAVTAYIRRLAPYEPSSP